MNDDASEGTAKTALIAEDDFFVAMNLETMIREAGWQVTGPYSGMADALRAANDEASIDIAFVDIQLNGEKAFPAIDALIARGTRVVLSTGYSMDSLPEAYRGLARLGKPYTADMVKRLLDDADA